ncbi:MAG: metal-sulfur cluster assembly factor [Chitinivorax sp.]
MSNVVSNPHEPDAIRTILRQVIDPEVGINIVDMGLIYRIESSPQQLLIEMTMTSPACPMGELIEDEARAALAAALPQHTVELRLVWEPPWEPSMMSESAREHFGW